MIILLAVLTRQLSARRILMGIVSDCSAVPDGANVRYIPEKLVFDGINYLQGFFETNPCENLSHNLCLVYNRIF